MSCEQTQDQEPRKVGMGAVRERLGGPAAAVAGKILGHIDEHSRRSIAHSPFLSMATADAAGPADCWRRATARDS